MQDIYQNIYNSERSVEVVFASEMIRKYASSKKLLDVGGIPTSNSDYNPIYQTIKEVNTEYKISDFRGGDYVGDFVTITIPEKFDVVLFLSSLEHFPQCTEGDMIFRPGEDRRGYEKALSILNDNGIILFTAPFGICRWQNYHQNYDLSAVKGLTKGSTIIEQHIYRLIDNTWIKKSPEEMSDVLYTNKAYGVGCFVMKKD